MIAPEALKAVLESAFEKARVEVFDKTGANDHYIVYINTAVFNGLPTLARNRMVNAAVKPLIESGQLHAIEIKTDTPAQSP